MRSHLLSFFLCCSCLPAATLVFNGGVTGTVYTAVAVDENTPAPIPDGLLVSATFSDGNTFSCALSSVACEVTNRFRVTLGNVFNSPNLWNGSIVNESQSHSLISSNWNALAANAVWDIIAQVEVTPGSGPGLAVSGTTYQFFPNQSSSTVTATAYNAVQLAGSGGPLGDLFTNLEFEFSGLPYQNSLAFSVDVDSLTTTDVPDVPAMLQILSGGLLFLGQRLRKNS